MDANDNWRHHAETTLIRKIIRLRPDVIGCKGKGYICRVRRSNGGTSKFCQSCYNSLCEFLPLIKGNFIDIDGTEKTLSLNNIEDVHRSSGQRLRSSIHSKKK